ncbi:MAG: hypothetical protein HY542_02565 [Deltaproteobacteria bacterium]|nr:hypothetical protein [Deltaproteobacteria bacterium]
MKRLTGATLLTVLFPLLLWAASFSDIAREEFEKGPRALLPYPRSPFTPGASGGEEVDIATLAVEGIVWSHEGRMALLSGRVVREGERLAKYEVRKIDRDRVLLMEGDVVYPLSLQNYLPPPQDKAKGGGYQVELRKAPLRDALRLLATAERLNIISPETLVGEVTVSLYQIKLMQAIRSILRVNGYEYAVESDIIRVGKPDDFAGGTDLMTNTFSLRYATATDLVASVKLLLSDRGQVIADARTNTLTVKDRDPIIASIHTLIREIDRKDRQVRIEARIVDATRDFSRSLGIRWGIAGTKGNVTVSGTEDVGKSKDNDKPLGVNMGADGATSGVQFLISKIGGIVDIEGQLTAAEQKGDISILSKPSVSTLNNMPAKIRSGTKIYVKSTSSISLGTTAGSAGGDTSGLQEIDTGIELTVTPQITVDNTIKLKIDATQSEADFSRTVDGIPAVVDSTASTTVILEDGSTAVIGGLYRVRSSIQRKGVPGFNKIPILGYLFQNKSKTKTDTELMIFITPKLVSF